MSINDKYFSYDYDGVTSRREIEFSIRDLVNLRDRNICYSIERALELALLELEEGNTFSIAYFALNSINLFMQLYNISDIRLSDGLSFRFLRIRELVRQSCSVNIMLRNELAKLATKCHSWV